MNYWYVAKETEILIDMDKPLSSLPHAEARLEGAMHFEKLSVRKVETHPSFTPTHSHTVITLWERMPQIERAVWGVMFHSDIYRGMSTIMRCVYNVPSPDLLITPEPFMREPDATCECTGKHNAATMYTCGAAITLRGDQRVQSFFGLPIKPLVTVKRFTGVWLNWNNKK